MVFLVSGMQGCRGELRFLYCDVRLCCEQEMLKFFHGAPYAVCVELNNFISLCFVCFVCGSVRVWGAGVGDVGVATYGSLCDGDMWGGSGRVGCIRSRV